MTPMSADALRTHPTGFDARRTVRTRAIAPVASKARSESRFGQRGPKPERVAPPSSSWKTPPTTIRTNVAVANAQATTRERVTPRTASWGGVCSKGVPKALRPRDGVWILRAMPQLVITLLGAPSVAVGRAPVHTDTRKATALLAYLAVSEQPQRRATLATLFWPETSGDIASALAHAKARLALDPLHEPAHRDLMRLYARSGDRSAALRQYHECVRLLDGELGVAPIAETKALHDAIEAGTLPSDRPTSVAATAEAVGDLHTLHGDYQRAIESYETAITKAPASARAALEHKLAQVHHRRGDWA